MPTIDEVPEKETNVFTTSPMMPSNPTPAEGLWRAFHANVQRRVIGS